MRMLAINIQNFRKLLLITSLRKRKIVPMYYVKADNLPSIRLASSAGFEIMQKEAVRKYEVK